MPESLSEDPIRAVPGSVTLLFTQLKDQDPAAIAEIWRRFFPRMTALARATLQRLPRSLCDSDDVAQSSFVSFWRLLAGPQPVELNGRDDLWRLLAVLTVRKARQRARSELAIKRGGKFLRRDLENQDRDENSMPVEQALACVQPPEFDLMLTETLLELDEPQRTVAVLRLQGFSNAEIAASLDCHVRSVQRVLLALRARWSRPPPD